MSYSLLKFHLDTHRFSSIPLPDLWPGAMVRACVRVRVRVQRVIDR